MDLLSVSSKRYSPPKVFCAFLTHVWRISESFLTDFATFLPNETRPILVHFWRISDTFLLLPTPFPRTPFGRYRSKCEKAKNRILELGFQISVPTEHLCSPIVHTLAPPKPCRAPGSVAAIRAVSRYALTLSEATFQLIAESSRDVRSQKGWALNTQRVPESDPGSAPRVSLKMRVPQGVLMRVRSREQFLGQ